VTTVGHSLGAALSLLDAIFLPLHISVLLFTYYGYGLPRVRTVMIFLQIETTPTLSLRRSEIKAFANYVDSKLAGKIHTYH